MQTAAGNARGCTEHTNITSSSVGDSHNVVCVERKSPKAYCQSVLFHLTPLWQPRTSIQDPAVGDECNGDGAVVLPPSH